MQPWNPFWTLTEGEGTSVGDYLGNVAQWFVENISPTTWVYQNNSRAPGYNVWRTLWNAFIPVTAMFSAGTLAWPDPRVTTFYNNVGNITKNMAPTPTYTANPSNIPIRWTSASNLPKYTTAPSRAPVPNLWSKNPSNIEITPTSLTKFKIPGPSVSLY